MNRKFHETLMSGPTEVGLVHRSMATHHVIQNMGVEETDIDELTTTSDRQNTCDVVSLRIGEWWLDIRLEWEVTFGTHWGLSMQCRERRDTKEGV